MEAEGTCEEVKSGSCRIGDDLSGQKRSVFQNFFSFLFISGKDTFCFGFQGGKSVSFESSENVYASSLRSITI